MRQSASRHLNIRGAVGEMRTAQFEGRDHVVLPIVALVEGVIWPINAPTPEFVPADTLSFVPAGWNGRPVFASVGHPVNDDGQQVSGNSPAVLENAIGMVFNAKTDGKRLLMEAWIDPSKPEAKPVLDRVQNGEIVEVSVGAFVVTEASKGTFGGRNYDAIWREVVPDHLALLPPGDEGACSAKMGCGIRAAHLITAEGIVFQTAEEFMTHLKSKFSNPEAITTLVSFGEGIAVYTEHDGKSYRQSYTVNDKELVLAAERVEVKPVTYYEPTDVKAAKGARHSATDMARIQAMHDSAVELGAQCAPKAMAGKPCGCHDNSHKEQNMKKEQREALTKALKEKVKPEVWARYEALAKASSSDILDAIVAQIKEKLGLSDAAAADLSNLAEATLVELAGLSAPPDPTKKDAPPSDGGAAGGAAYTGAAAKKEETPKVKTEAEWLAEAPASIKTLVSDAKDRDEKRRATLVTAIKAVTKEYTDEDFKTMSTKELERVSRICAAKVPEIDFSLQGARETNDQTPQSAPEPPNIVEMFKAAEAKRKR